MPSAPTGRPDRSGSEPLGSSSPRSKGRLSDDDARALADGLPAGGPADDLDAQADASASHEVTSVDLDSDDLDSDDLDSDDLDSDGADDLGSDGADDSADDEAASGTTLTKRRTRTAAGTTTSTTQSKNKAKPERRARERTGNPFVRLVRFIREVVGEMRKVLWPTRRELGVYTVAVIIFVTVLVAIVGGLDFGFARLVLLVFG